MKLPKFIQKLKKAGLLLRKKQHPQAALSPAAWRLLICLHIRVTKLMPGWEAGGKGAALEGSHPFSLGSHSLVGATRETPTVVLKKLPLRGHKTGSSSEAQVGRVSSKETARTIHWFRSIVRLKRWSTFLKILIFFFALPFQIFTYSRDNNKYCQDFESFLGLLAVGS